VTKLHAPLSIGFNALLALLREFTTLLLPKFFTLWYLLKINSVWKRALLFTTGLTYFSVNSSNKLIHIINHTIVTLLRHLLQPQPVCQEYNYDGLTAMASAHKTLSNLIKLQHFTICKCFYYSAFCCTLTHASTCLNVLESPSESLVIQKAIPMPKAMP